METRRSIEATCPECRGPLTEIRHDADMVEFQCLVGHRYSAKAVLNAHSDTEEKTLWSGVVALEEAATLVRAASPFLPPGVRECLAAQADERMQYAQTIREILRKLTPFETT